MDKKTQLTIELSQKLRYSNGYLYWRVSPSTKIPSGSLAGSMDKRGVVSVMYKHTRILSHRVVYFMHHEVLPEFIDHVDGNPSNNKIENLRACTISQNAMNSRTPAHNSSGFKNVRWHVSRGKWVVSLQVNKKPKWIGSFDDFQEACDSAKRARIEFYGEWSNVS